MIRWQIRLASFLFLLLSGSAFGQACTVTLNPGNDIKAQVETLAAGSTICLNPGNYTATNTGFPGDGSNTFPIGQRVTIRGLGATPADTKLRGNGSTTGYVVWFVDYLPGKSSSGSTLLNLTLENAQGGVQIFDFVHASPQGRLADITLKDLVINTPGTISGPLVRGVLAQYVDRLIIDNVTATTALNNFFLFDARDSVLMNSSAPFATVDGATGLAMIGGMRNVIVNNTFGSPKVGSTYSFNAGGITFYNSQDNRFENNIVQGFRDDGLDFHAKDLSVEGMPAPQNLQRSSDNYAGKNTIIGSGLADGRDAGSAIWSNCSSDRAWLFGNESRGVPECGICVYTSLSNMVLANTLHDNGLGFLLSGGGETLPFCGPPSFQARPVSTFIKSNSAYFNKIEQVYVRSADTTEVASNFMSPRNGFGGALRPAVECQQIYCQSALTFDTQGTTPATNGARIVANTNHDNHRGFYADDGQTTNLEFVYNRMIQSNLPLAHSRYNFPTGTTFWDGGPAVGGNFWTIFPTPNGNPGTNAYGTVGNGDATKGVYDISNQTGRIVDRYAYRSEDMGRGGSVTVFEPRSAGPGASLAQGTRRTVRWYSPGCVYNDISLDGSTMLAANAPNTGYAIVTIPVSTPVGAHNIVVSCKDSAGNVKASGSGATVNFNVTPSTLQILAPGRDDVFNAGSQITVAWKKSSAIATVNIELSTNGGTSFVSLGTSTATTARVTLPAGAAVANAVMRVRSASPVAEDHTDGWFAIRGTGQAFINMASRKFVAGQTERLEWSSPANSRLVDITATSGSVTKTVAANLPDRGNFDWVLPDMPPGAVTFAATFKNSAGGTLGTANAAATMGYATTITYGTLPSTLGIGSGTTVTMTTSSGLPATLTSLTPSVCTVSGTTVTGVAAGTCIIAANQAGNGSYAASPQVTASFTVGTVSNPPRLANISTRMQVLTGNDVMIGGFVIGGSVNKTVAIVATGPSLAAFGISNPLANPTLQLVRSSDQTVIATNDNWQSASNSAALQAAGFAPSNALESAIMVNLPPGAYTAIVSGVGGGTGVGIVAVYEVDHPEVPLINISTRGQVLTGNDVMIGGFVIQGSGPQTVVVVATGPSLAAFGIANPLANPTLQLVRSSDQVVIATNDNWQSASNAAQIQAAGFAPSNTLESAIMMSLPPGAYTAIVSGVSGGTGVGVVAVYTVP